MLPVWNLRTHSPVDEEIRFRERKGPPGESIQLIGIRSRASRLQAILLFRFYHTASVSMMKYCICTILLLNFGTSLQVNILNLEAYVPLLYSYAFFFLRPNNYHLA